MDADRVRSYRRQLREGILPPALLWWVSGLNTLLVLDGHDRIAAALAEQVVPEVAVLAPAVNTLLASDWQHRAIEEYVNRVEHLKAVQANRFAPVHIASISRQFAATLTRIARAEGRTRAWQVPGGRAAWDQQARQLTPDWTSDLPAATE
ncbi:MAG TPA: hypothetical protein VFX61_15195 [Micromonosporaceae bacterium]|nr:hypothetical protein [Micromonosporaceae bacterium]